MDKEQTLQIIEEKNTDVSIYRSGEEMEHWQRIAKMLSSSDIVPQAYRGNIANTMVALEISQRLQTSPFMVMQNLDIIKGKPNWSGQFVIAIIKQSPRFKNFRIIEEGDIESNEPAAGYRAYAENAETGDTLKGTKITWRMVKGEGWLEKGGSKWKTMPEQMFKYRAATFWGREHAPDLLAGMLTSDERYDVEGTAPDDQASEFDKRIIKLIETSTTIDELRSYKDKCETDITQNAYNNQLSKLENQNQNGRSKVDRPNSGINEEKEPESKGGIDDVPEAPAGDELF